MKQYLITYTADYDVNYELKVHFVKEFINKKAAVIWSNLCSNIVLSKNMLVLVAEKKSVYCFNTWEYDFFQLTDERKKNVLPAISIDGIHNMSEAEKNELFTNNDYYYNDGDYVKIDCSIADLYRKLSKVYGTRNFCFSILSYSVNCLSKDTFKF